MRSLIRIRPLVTSFLFLGAVTPQGAEEHDPATELASFQVAEGFDASLFASESDGVVKPIQIRFDPRGRLWVIGSSVYPQVEPGQAPNDKVLILEDTNRDGRADKTTIFADGLMIPTGLELVEGGAYIGHGTDLLLLKDTDGDGKADDRRVVLRGFGTGDNHQNINSFLWGPGGELWMCQGLHIHSNVETPWGIVRLHKAGLWRFRPNLKKLEGFYGSEHEPQNPWGYVFTDWGEPIVIAGNNSSMIYPVPGLTARHLDLPPTLIWPKGQGRKSSGADIVGTTHFPAEWQGLLITGGYINNAVWALKISEDGSGFALTDLPPLIRSTSRSFRPVDVKFGPDGAVYICDWYNPIIGHYQASFRHPDRDKTHGRIWRVIARGRSLTEPPALVNAPIDALLNNLASTDRWTRQHSKRVLADRPGKDVAAAILDWVKHGPRTEHALTEALGVLKSHEIVDAQLLEKLSKASEASARAYAASVIGGWADRLPNAFELLRPLVEDEHPRVRLHAVVAASYLTAAEAVELVAIATERPSDKFIEYALRQAVFALKPYWLPELKSGRLKLSAKPPHLAFLVRTDGTPDTLGALRELLQTQSLDESTRESFLLTLAETGTPADLGLLLDPHDHPGRQSRLLAALTTTARVRGLKPSGDLAARLQPHVTSSDPAVRGRAIRLAGTWKIERFSADVRKAVSDPAQPEPVLAGALEALAALADSESHALLCRLANDAQFPLRPRAIVSLAELDLPKAAETVAQFSKENSEASRDRKVWEEIFTAFFQKHEGASALLKSFEKDAPPHVVAETGLRIMNSSGRRHESLAALFEKQLGITSSNPFGDLAALVSDVRLGGDSKRGEEVFRRPELGCVTCHAIKGEGGKLGPDLSVIGTAQPVDFILGAILEPQKEIKEGFTSILVTTRDGDEYQGYSVRETAEELVLREALRSEEVLINKSNIQHKKQSGSIMPTGLVNSLTREEFRDLIRYLAEQGKPN